MRQVPPARLVLALTAAAFVTISACGGSDSSESATRVSPITQQPGASTAPSDADEPSSAPAPSESPDSPATATLLDFEAQSLDGDVVEVSEFTGTPLVVWFWEPH